MSEFNEQMRLVVITKYESAFLFLVYSSRFSNRFLFDKSYDSSLDIVKNWLENTKSVFNTIKLVNTLEDKADKYNNVRLY